MTRTIGQIEPEILHAMATSRSVGSAKKCGCDLKVAFRE